MPAAAPLFAQHVKPVNEEPEEEDVSRESLRERDDNEDSRDLSQEPNSEEEVSEEVPRAVLSNPSLRTLGASVPPVSSGPSPVYRPPQVTVTPTSVVRGSVATPPPPPIQYRPTQKPTKAPRKQIIDDVAFRQPIKPPPKPVKPSQVYEIRGKKPVAQVRLIETRPLGNRISSETSLSQGWNIDIKINFLM